MTDDTSCQSPVPDDAGLSADEARQRMLDAVTPIAHAEKVALRNALGRVLHADVIAPLDVPAHDNSAMAGYAIRFDSPAAGPARIWRATRPPCLRASGWVLPNWA